jgi:hypothetical protein
VLVNAVDQFVERVRLQEEMVAVAQSLKRPTVALLNGVDQDLEHVGLPDAEGLDITVGDCVGQRLDSKERSKYFRPRLAPGHLFLGKRDLNLPASLLEPGDMNHFVGRIERPQAGSKRPPFAMMFQDDARQSDPSRRLVRLKDRCDCIDFFVNPLTIDFQKNGSLVLEVSIERARRVARRDRDAVGVRAVIADRVEQLRRGIDQRAAAGFWISGSLLGAAGSRAGAPVGRIHLRLRSA